MKDEKCIGEGFNSPPGNAESQRRCTNTKVSYAQKVTDKTCCIHAEQRAILHALSKNAHHIVGATMYFARLYTDNEKTESVVGNLPGDNKLYCTVYTKMMFDVGIDAFVLRHTKGYVVYEKDEYLDLSFQYH